MKVTLTVTSGPETGRVMEFSQPRGFVIGRAADADLQIKEDPYVSRRHVFLEICPPACRLKDLGSGAAGSTNPPHVDGAQVRECELKDGSVIEIGYTRLLVGIKLQPAVRKGRCLGCGATMELLAGEADPPSCPACPPQPPPPPPPAPRLKPAAACRRCCADLMPAADSDGRAAELSAFAVYECPKCLRVEPACKDKTLAGYHLCRVLGKGGMGIVFQVYQPSTCRLFALKRVLQLSDRLQVGRFGREMEIIRRLAHPNVVQCLETGVDAQGAPYLVTELVPDGDLEALVSKSGGRLAPPQAAGLTGSVLAGLVYLHSRNVVHRDIKPPNILLRQDQGRLTPKLGDFGLAKAFGQAGGTVLTQPNTGLGTLMFMPPEQIRDAASATETADVYAVGVTLYYLLTGKYSFNFPTPEDVRRFQAAAREGAVRSPEEGLRRLLELQRIMHPFQIVLGEEPVPVRKRDASLPPRLAAVVDRAVQKDPKQRFQSAAQFRDALLKAV